MVADNTMETTSTMDTSDDAHPFHTSSGEAVSGAALSWATCEDEACAAFASAVVACDECCSVYYAQKPRLDADAHAIAHQRDQRRLKDALSLIANAAALDQDKKMRRMFTTYAYEILKYPEYLQDWETDALFIAALLACQRVKMLKLKTPLLPGIVLLAAHENAFVRNWALNSMVQMDPSLYTDRAHFDSIDASVRVIVNRVMNTTPQRKYNLVSDPLNLWHCLATVLCCFTPEGILTLLEMFPTLDAFVCESLLKHAPLDSDPLSPFPHILTCFSKFRDANVPIANASTHLLTSLWSSILSSTWFQMTLKTTLWLETTTNLHDTWTTAFAWIPSVLATLHPLTPPSSHTVEGLLTSLVNDFESCSIHAKPELVRLAFLPILSTIHTYTLPKQAVDALCAASLSCCSVDSDIVLTRLVMECLDADVDTLEQVYQDMYRECNGFDEAAPGASLLHAEIWRTLGSARGGHASLAPVFQHVFKVFGRCFLYDHVNLECAPKSVGEFSAAQREYVQSFNTGLSLVWFVVHRGLGLSASMGGEEVANMAEMLYCLVCRSDDISKLAKKILCDRAEVDTYEAMLSWLLLQENNESSKIETLVTILDTFRDLCTMGGPPLLGCAERIQKVLTHVYTVVFSSDESYRFNDTNSDLWIKSWPFVSSVLSSSVKWAKQDLSLKKDIKLIIAHTFHIVRHLLNHCNVLTSKHMISSATVPFMNTVWSLFQWYRVMEDTIREEAVALTVVFLKAAEGFRYVLDEALVGAIVQYIDGSLKSRLSEASKKVLETWMVGMLDRQEAKKPKVAVVEQKVVVQEVAKAGRKVSGGVSSVVAPAAKLRKVESTAEAIKRVQALPVAPKPAGKLPAGQISKLSQLRQTHIAEQRRHVQEATKSRTIATILARGDSSDEDSSTFKPSSIKMLDEDGMAVDLSLHKKSLQPHKLQSGPVPKKKVITRFRNMNELYKIFLRWRVDDRGNVPQEFPFELGKIPDRFESNDDYANVFEPLVVLELWEQFKTSVEETDFGKAFAWTLDSCMMLDEFHDITFMQPFEDSKKRVTDSDLIYIQSSGAKTTDRKGFLGKVQKMYTRKGESTYIVRVYLKHQHMIVPLLFENSKWSVTKLFSMTTVMREYESLLQLPKVALCSEVIQPLYRKKFVPKEGSVERAMKIFGANRPQAEAIATATQRPSGFVLIQGPPGTGKTKTILSLVGSLLTSAATAISTPGTTIKTPGSAIRPPGGGSAIRPPGGGSAIRPPGGGSAIRAPGGRGGPPQVMASRNAPPSTAAKKNRLMICAPSNAACDEIVRRLKCGILNAQGNPFNPKIVRLGTSDSISADVRDLTIESLVKEQLAIDHEFRKVNQETNDNSQWIALEKHQAELNKERTALREKEEKETKSVKEADLVRSAIAKVSEKLRSVDEQFKQLKQKRLEREGSSDHIRSRIKASLLLEADVIMATLSGAGHDIVSTLQNFEFPTVIIDEACQSVELSSLIPLRYGAKKCILVGDPMQLPPTVLSPTAKRFGYENSLFQRIMGMHGDSVCLLSIQYRMHPHISSFPSQQFYKSRLLDAEDMSNKCIAPWHQNAEYPTYRFLNVGWGRELRERHSLYNPDEIIACVNLVAKLCIAFPGLKFASRIGVITPYRMQMLKMKDKFKEKFGYDILDYVDINTIDAFQGREKDIIILSTVRAGLGEAVGFLRDKRRMNVALTRAKNSLFIVGRGVSLCNNEDWRALVEDCQRRSMFVEMERKEFGPAAKFNYAACTNLRD
ncbi:DEAD-box type RNA helicase [Podochytrium sp. JEL0797]|nr:DEAD-box type RNA helicase [Podochytrium sp. JEL0797]